MKITITYTNNNIETFASTFISFDYDAGTALENDYLHLGNLTELGIRYSRRYVKAIDGAEPTTIALECVLVPPEAIKDVKTVSVDGDAVLVRVEDKLLNKDEYLAWLEMQSLLAKESLGETTIVGDPEEKIQADTIDDF
jgi:hypothetical protein